MIERLFLFLLRNIDKAEIALYKRRMHLSGKIRFRRPLFIQHPENMHLGKDVAINRNCTFLAHGGISIGENTMIGPNVAILTVDHDYRVEGIGTHTAHKISPVVIGRNAWIGANAVVLPGVSNDRGRRYRGCRKRCDRGRWGELHRRGESRPIHQGEIRIAGEDLVIRNDLHWIDSARQAVTR